ncbi:hypothetical protein [Candidatus Micrarchaeum sp.]|nr:hypothetical protein [Candidatus Micrarchaeum sp.]
MSDAKKLNEYARIAGSRIVKRIAKPRIALNMQPSHGKKAKSPIHFQA